jgi:uncharacterized membrane protein YqiK
MLSQSLLAVSPTVGTTATLIIVAVLVIVVLGFLVGRSVFRIRANEVGILVKKFGGARMAPGQIIAKRGQIGVQAETLRPGLYFKFVLLWQVLKAGITEVGPDQIATVEAIDGQPLPPGRFTGDSVDCNKFQDGEAFLINGGKKGQQVDILTPGQYRINTYLFKVTVKPATVIGSESTGLVTAEDGTPLPSDFIIAPEPDRSAEPSLTTEQINPKARDHRHFQDGQAFIDSNGYRGPQLTTLQPGKYFINDLLFTVAVIPKLEIPPGFVGVMRSNVGKELKKQTTLPSPVLARPLMGGSSNESQAAVQAVQAATLSDATTPPTEPPATGLDMMKQTITADIETALINDKNQRGIYVEPLAPGTYNLNTNAYTVYLVPTSAIMVDWADSENAASLNVSRPSTSPVKNTQLAPVTTDPTRKGIDYFNYSQLEVISADGFQLEVGVRMVIRIKQENAAFIIARFGTIANLIQQIVHPLIDSSFRNDAGEKKALEFFQSRTDLQKYVFGNAIKVFSLYRVEAQNLLISFIRPGDEAGQNLLNTQNLKEIALQQQTQFQQQASAEQQRIVVQEQTARANMQPQVVNAILQIDIEKNLAESIRQKSLGLRDYNINIATGNAEAIRRTGEAQADAYHAQTDVIGADKVALLNALMELQKTTTRLVPETLVVGGGKDGGDTASLILTGWLATMLNKPSPQVDHYERKYAPSSVTPPSSSGPSPGMNPMAATVSSLMPQTPLSTPPEMMKPQQVDSGNGLKSPQTKGDETPSVVS